MHPNYLKLLRGHWDTIFLIAGIVLILSLIFTFVQPLKYGASVRLLIIQRTSLSLSTYDALKSAERISDNLSRIIYTTAFFDEVMKGASINKNYFSSKEYKKRKQWGKMVDVQVTRGTGLLTITIYHQDKNQARLVAQSVADVLVGGWEYVGGGDVQVKIVDTPLVSRYPVKPNIPLNIVMGLVFGLLLGIGYVLAIHQHKTGLFKPF